MQGNLIMLTVITFLHDLFTVVWVGGLITTGIAVLPAVKKQFGMSPQTRQLMQAVQRKLRVMVYISIVGLFATGMLMLRRNPQFHGLLTWDDSYSTILALKHLLVILMVAIALMRSLVVGRIQVQPGASVDGPPQGVGSPKQKVASRKDKISALLLLINIILGIGVLLFSAAAAALSAHGGKLPI